MSDYVVIGAGAAGCVLAGRLTESASTSVTLLEAGGTNKKFLVSLPAGFNKLFKSNDDWAYFTSGRTRTRWSIPRCASAASKGYA